MLQNIHETQQTCMRLLQPALLIKFHSFYFGVDTQG